LLAALIGLSLFLNHRLVVTHKHTVEGNLRWAARVSWCDTLAREASGVSTPGSDVLRSRDAAAESLRVHAALARFNTTLDAQRNELSRSLPPNDAAALMNDCAHIEKEMNDLVKRTDAIFSSIRDNKTEELNSQIALMSHDYDDVLRALDLFRTHLRARRSAYLEDQEVEAQGLAKLEWLLGGLVLVLAAGIIIHAIKSERRASVSGTELRESERKYRALVEQSPDAITTADDRWNIRFANAAACKMLGYTEEELLRLSMLDTYPPEDLKIGEQRMAEMCVGQTLHYERNMRRKDGTCFPVEMIVRRVAEGLYQGIWRDISARKQAEADLENLHKQLSDASRQAGMAEVVTDVLHNVGNVLNSVNVSFAVVSDKVRKSKLSNLARAAELLQEHKHDLAAFLNSDPKGTQLPGYLVNLAQHLAEEQAEILKELQLLSGNVEHIKEIVAMQQSYYKVSGAVESLPVAELVEDALRMNAATLARHDVQIVREYAEAPPLLVEKHKVLQILVNLIGNAKYALNVGGQRDKRLTLRIAKNGSDFVHVSVIDNGVGISTENLTRIFEHGFTTRKDGHGFGLHSSAFVAKELGGTLTVHSDGVGKGATFTLTLPRPPKDGNS
jgi:PAS domain S-box-containing protein